MRIVIAPQALKGSLSAAETGQAIAEGVLTIFPQAELCIMPIADGGEGTVQALVDATGGVIIAERVSGPLAEEVEAFYGLLGDGRTAVIEMAACAGLPLLQPEERNPLLTSTYGVGELILAALERGCRHFILGIGGSATNDGGAGMAQALGAQLNAAAGQAIVRGGAGLARLVQIDVTRMDPRLRDCTFEVACDVSNPLCGPTGASVIYGPQKGASPAMVVELEAALRHYAAIIERDLQRSILTQPGSGAAGGLGGGLLAFLNAQLRPGAQIVLEAVRLAEHLADTDLLITAEGQLDAQTAYGKSVAAVARLAKSKGIPVLALAGSLGEDYQSLYELGIAAIAVLPAGPISLAYAMQHAAQLTRESSERALRMMRLGSKLPKER